MRNICESVYQLSHLPLGVDGACSYACQFDVLHTFGFDKGCVHCAGVRAEWFAERVISRLLCVCLALTVMFYEVIVDLSMGSQLTPMTLLTLCLHS